MSATLEHANLNVRSLAKSLPFYERLLGWEIRWEGLTSQGLRWIHLGPAEGSGYLSIYEDPAAFHAREDAAVRVQHLGFAVDDVAGREKALAADGIAPTDRVDDGRFRRVYYADPDGHELELVERL